MAKTLEFTTRSPQQIKQGDTETTFTFICKNAGTAVDLTQATSITAKIGNASGYLRSQSIAITSLAGLNLGWLNLQPTPNLISGLPAGNYQLEIWVIDQAGTSIYPSDNPLGFTITNNIENESGATITTITFDDFVGAINKAASTIAKGDKGDTGSVDNTGLISAPAFQSLQTQVDNSAVGTNLLTGTSSDLILDDSSDTSQGFKYVTVYTDLIVGSVYTFSSEVSVLGTATSIDVRPCNPTNGYTINHSYTTFPIVDGKISGLVKPTDGYTDLIIYAGNSGNTHRNKVTLNHMKLEKGSVATDWCPNPSEILTQADYAKIQAAIVALGGSLS